MRVRRPGSLVPLSGMPSGARGPQGGQIWKREGEMVFPEEAPTRSQVLRKLIFIRGMWKPMMSDGTAGGVLGCFTRTLTHAT